MPAVVFAADKGGTAKTTSVANVAVALALSGRAGRVCAIDCDPQSDLSASLGVEDADVAPLAAWLAAPTNADLRPAKLESGLEVIPASPEQADVAMDLAGQRGGITRLREVCDRLSDDGVDWILLDPPPGTAPMLTLAMVAADAAVVTAASTDLDIRGATGLLDRMDDGEFDDDRRMLLALGVLLVRVKAKRVLRRQAQDTLRDAEITVVPVEIPDRESVGGHMRHGKPAVELEPDGVVAAAYRKVADWLVDEHAKAA